MARYHGIDLGEDKKEETSGRNKILAVVGGVVAVLAVAIVLFMVLDFEGDSTPNILGQDELAKYIEEHPELRNNSDQSE